MAWFEDLSICNYFPFDDSSLLRAVGWLERGQPFPSGDVEEQVFERLCELTQDPWSPQVCMGVHHCDLCRFTGNSEARFQRIVGSSSIRAPGYAVSAASAGVSLFVPGDGVIYVSPTNITHYIDAHGYCPPDEFQTAVMDCPPMRSMAYLKAILGNGGRQLGMSSLMSGKNREIEL